MKLLGTVLSGGNRLHRRKNCRWVPREGGKLYVWSGDWRYTLQFSFGRGIWLLARCSGLALRAGQQAMSYQFRRPIMKKREAAKGRSDAPHLAPVETERFKDLMSLVEHCCVRRYDDGDARETGWFTVKVQGAAWIVQVKDPDTCSTFSAVGETLDKALEIASLMLSCDEAPWEPDRFLLDAAARKKKAK